MRRQRVDCQRMDYLCNKTEEPGSTRDQHADGYCHWMDLDGSLWDVSVDDDGIAWTWCVSI